ncbi:MAG: hypothetical protein CBB66_05400 [bacterium TMED6]|nr:MAG: hypothetical protein CBB66_05400 [bacterium TMED6]|tara:strand:+ start:1461 stop:2093 length:633 start_codon:yes stop_codon:yes gene_type:complete
MLNKNRQRRYNYNKPNYILILKNNSSIILFFTILVIMIYSIIDYNFFNEPPIVDVQRHNLEKIREFNLNELYNQKNLNHNEVRIWILNNTDQTGLAGKMRDCFEIGYQKNEKKIKGDYIIYKQDNFKSEDRYDLGKINSEVTKVFVHVDLEDYPKFKTHIQEFLSFTGFESEIIDYEYSQKLYQERDITIILGNNWNKNNNLIYCKESIN